MANKTRKHIRPVALMSLTVFAGQLFSYDRS